MSGSQFSSEVPKGDAWGVEHALDQAAREFEETGHSPMIPCIAVLGVKEVKLIQGDDGPARKIVAKLFRVNALTTPQAIRDGQKLILRALGDQQGRGDSPPILPFETKDVLEMAFGSLNVKEIEQDEREAMEDQNMDDPQRLRRHLVAVHKMTPDEVEGMEWVDVQTRHKSDHDRPAEDGLPPHDVESWIWRRVDLEAAEAESDGTPDGDEDQDAAEDEDDTADGAGDEDSGAPAVNFQAPADGDQED
jgi:hypothetical protein